MNNQAHELNNLGFTPVLLGDSGDSLKRPIQADWPNLRPTAQDIAGWPAANNIGMLCGPQENGLYLAVFDFDKYAAEIFPAWLEQARALVGSPITIVKTGTGYHAPFLVIGDTPKTSLIAGEHVRDANGRRRTDVIIEVQADGRQVVSAGSRHPSGRNYELQEGSYDWMPPITAAQYAELVVMARAHDRRETAPQRAVITTTRRYEPTGELAGVTDCLEYAKRFIAHDRVTHTTYERNGESIAALKFGGNGGLYVYENGRGWHCFAADRGGNLIDLVAYHRGISAEQAIAMLAANNNVDSHRRQAVDSSSFLPEAGRLAQAAPPTPVIGDRGTLALRQSIARHMAGEEWPERYLTKIDRRVNEAGDQMLASAWNIIRSGRNLAGHNVIEQYVDTYITPTIAGELQTAEPATASELARGLWPDDEPSLTLPFETAGTGEWPAAPAREDKKAEPIGSVLAITPGPRYTTVRTGYRWRRAWETDKREYFYRARREVEKVHAEMVYCPMYWHTFDGDEAAARFINARRMADKRAANSGQDIPAHVYCYYPHVTGTGYGHVLVSNYAAGAAGQIPTDRIDALSLFDAWVNTPEETELNRKSNGYGRQWQGMKGDGSARYVLQGTAAAESGESDTAAPTKAIQLITDTLPDELLKAIGRTTGQKVFSLDNGQMEDFFRLLRERVPDARMKGGGNPLSAWRAAVPKSGIPDESNKKVSQTWVQEQQSQALQPADMGTWEAKSDQTASS